MAIALRRAGHEVLDVGDVARGATDERVAALAKAQGAILLTEDRDLARLVKVLNKGVHGVIYVRWPARARNTLGPDLVALVRAHGDELRGAFVVFSPGRARIRRMAPS